MSTLLDVSEQMSGHVRRNYVEAWSKHNFVGIERGIGADNVDSQALVTKRAIVAEQHFKLIVILVVRLEINCPAAVISHDDGNLCHRLSSFQRNRGALEFATDAANFVVD